METQFYIKKHPIFLCKMCDFTCSKKGDYNRHLSTQKHKWKQMETHFTSKNIKPTFLVCSCGKKYKTRSGMWKHQTKCEIYENENNEKVGKDEKGEYVDISHNEVVVINDDTTTNAVKNDETMKELVYHVLEENKDLRTMIVNQQQQIQELIPKVGKGQTNNVNINVFLNSQCKDAINIMDFVNMISNNANGVELMGELGFVNGITKIFLDGLQNMDVYKRPIHCCDVKNEVLYIKDDDQWNLEKDNKPILKKAITKMKRNNLEQIPNWIENNPSCMDSNDINNDKYIKIISNSIGGIDDKQEKNVEKIIKNVSKNVVVRKEDLQQIMNDDSKTS